MHYVNNKIQIIFQTQMHSNAKARIGRHASPRLCGNKWIAIPDMVTGQQPCDQS